MTVTLDFLGTRMEQLQSEQRELRDRISRLESSVEIKLHGLETLVNDRVNILRELISYQTDAILALERRVNGMLEHFSDADAVLHRQIQELREEVVGRLDRLEAWSAGVDTQLDRLEAWSAGVDARLDRLEAWSAGIDARLDRLEAWSAGIDARLDRLEGRLDQIDARLDRLEGRLDQIDARLDRVEELLVQVLDRLPPRTS